MKGKSKKKTKAAEVQQTYHVVEADAMAAVNLERLMQANVDLIAVDSKTGGLVGGLCVTLSPSPQTCPSTHLRTPEISTVLLAPCTGVLSQNLTVAII